MAAPHSDPGGPSGSTPVPPPRRRARDSLPGGRHPRVLGVLWTGAVLCGGLVLVLVFFATIGVIDFSSAPALGIIVLAMTVFWLVTMFVAGRATRDDAQRLRDRERRGF